VPRGGNGAGEPDDLLLESEGRTVPDSVALATAFWRGVRTTCPIILGDVLAVSLAGLAAHWVVLLAFSGVGGPAGLAGMTQVLTGVALLVCLWIAGLYTELWSHPAVELGQVMLASTITLLAVAVSTAGGSWQRSAAWSGVMWAGVVTFVPLVRALARCCCANRGWWGYPTVLVGSGAHLERLADAVLRAPHCALRPVLLSDDSGRCRSAGLPVVNDPAALESLVRAESISHAIVCLPDVPQRQLERVLGHYRGLVPHVIALANPEVLPALWTAGRRCDGVGGFEVHDGLMLARRRALKRMTDVAVSTLALALTLPLLLAIAMAVRCTSRGPALFGHRRIGRHGRPFVAWKFRTMRADADVVLREHLARDPAARREWERDLKLRDDPRVTRVGRWLRRLSLDELPQLWNVLRGEMSVVGPRPIVEKEVGLYGETFRLLALVRPGITGLWQVSGRNDLGYEERVTLDRFYVRHWSTCLDVYILARTVVALLSRRGAY
jgi:Undecaprenyl-phosphate galactose phosphotransferase WbaP